MDQPVAEALLGLDELAGIGPGVGAGQGDPEGQALVVEPAQGPEEQLRAPCRGPTGGSRARSGAPSSTIVAPGADGAHVDPDREQRGAGPHRVEQVVVTEVGRARKQLGQGAEEGVAVEGRVHEDVVGGDHRRPVPVGHVVVEGLAGESGPGRLRLVQVEGDGGAAHPGPGVAAEGGDVEHRAGQHHVGRAVLGHHLGGPLGQRDGTAPEAPAPVGPVVGHDVDVVGAAPGEALGPRLVRAGEPGLDQQDPHGGPTTPWRRAPGSPRRCARPGPGSAGRCRRVAPA